ncbi:MAG TPA: hypothetical protein PKJ85_10280 [Nitrosomonas nitrosa]|nr:hypothetical protein [Nitrosomonas nitrosa]
MNRHMLCTLVSICIGLTQVTSVWSAHEERENQARARSASKLGILDEFNRSITSHTLKIGETELKYTATATSITVNDKQSRPMGQIFYVAYTAKPQDGQSRPLTFVFNGGPGAASAYLHLGALGPRRVVFNADGSVPPMPARIADNAKSWLAFTDLVFVDPVGTGYSREIKQGKKGNQGKEANQNSWHSKNAPSSSKAWGVEEDTQSLSHFIRAYLTKENRWLSPIYLVGESYGGFRVARLSKRLQTNFNIAPSGLILISPVLDFSFIWGNERSLWPWVALLPSYAAVAAHHERSDQIHYKADNPRASLGEVERIALSDFLSGLATGTFSGNWLDQTSKLTSLDNDTLRRWVGRVPPARFTKVLLADQHRVLSLYDGSIVSIDPEPASHLLTGRDLYLDRLNVPMTTAFNSYIQEQLHFRTDLPYLLLNNDVFDSWNWRSGIRGRQGFVEAASDLKQAMSLHPDMRVLIMHGVFDLVTPYYASEIIIKQMALDPQISKNVQLKVYHGGHMPYLQERTFHHMYEDTARFYKSLP